MLPLVLADGWPTVMDTLYSLLMQCFDGSGRGGGGGRSKESIGLCLLVAASAKASTHSRRAAASRLAQLSSQLEHEVVYPMQALNEAVYDRQGVGEREQLEFSDGTGLWRMVCRQGMVSTVLQPSLNLPLTSPEEEGEPEAMHGHPPPPPPRGGGGGGDSGEEEKEEEEKEGGWAEKGKGACARSCEGGRRVVAVVEAVSTVADDTGMIDLDDTVMIDLGDGVILTSKRVPVPACFCDDEREEAAEGKEEEADSGGGARFHPPY